jgi:hypothetical protein
MSQEQASRKIGETITKLLLKGGRTDAQILAIVRRVHKGCRTTKNSVDWYRTQLRARGLMAGAAPRPKLSEAERDERRKAANAKWREERKAKFALERRIRERGGDRVEKMVARLVG